MVEIRVWPPSTWCAELNPERTHMCDLPRNHNGDHHGPELPTVTLDETPPAAGADAGEAGA
jgi:hypothetical protein